MIRNEQIKLIGEALSQIPLGEQARRVIEDLQSLEIIAPQNEAVEQTVIEYKARNSSSLDSGIDDIEFWLQALVEEQISEAHGYGIQTDLPVMHFVGYAFLYGLDWALPGQIQSILNNQQYSEAQKLNALNAVLASLKSA